MHWYIEQPWMAKNSHCCVVDVDDVMFCGDGFYWETVFLKKLKSTTASVIHSCSTFLKRKITRLESGLALIPGTKASRVIELFESHFGKARPQSIACDASIQTEDVSEEVDQRHAHAFRAVMGTLLCLARDRPDLLFVVKELSSSMSRPTLTAISRLWKVICYLRATSDFWMVLCFRDTNWRPGQVEKLWALLGHWDLQPLTGVATSSIVAQQAAEFILWMVGFS